MSKNPHDQLRHVIPGTFMRGGGRPGHVRPQPFPAHNPPPLTDKPTTSYPRHRLIATLILSLALGCGTSGTSGSREKAPPAFPLSVTDDAGRQVTIPALPRRI